MNDNDNDILKYVDKVYKYYHEKSNYEKSISNKKKEIKNMRLSNNEKKDLFRNYIPKCVSCKRNVSSVFETKKERVDNQTVVIRTAKCGDKTNPCQLNYELVEAIPLDVKKEKENEETIINNITTKTIVLSNDELFGYVSKEDAVSKTSQIHTDLNDSIDYYQSVLVSYMNVVDNKEKQKDIRNMVDLLNEHIITIKNNISEYSLTNNKQYIRDSVRLYTEEMRNNLNTINDKKYSYMRVEYNADEKEYKLVQNVLSLEDAIMIDPTPKIVSASSGKRLKNNVNTNEEEMNMSNNLVPAAIPKINSTVSKNDDIKIDSSNFDNIHYEDNDENPIIIGDETIGELDNIEEIDESNLDNIEDDGNAIDIDNMSESDVSEIESDIGDNNEPLTTLRIGETIDSSSDSFIPPPPPINEDENSSSSDSFIPPPPPINDDETSSSQ